MNKLNSWKRFKGVVFAVALVNFSLLSVAMAMTGESFAIPPNLYDARFVGTEGGVAIIEFSGDYNKNLSDGTPNSAARAVVAREFYAHNADNYDILVVFSDFDFDTGEATAFHTGVANGVDGIGLPIFSNSALFGSQELKGYIDMAAISRYQTNPLTSNSNSGRISFDSTLKVIAHETLHQWAAHTQIEDMQGRDDSHWSFFLDSDASVEYGHDWRDNQDGTFTAESARARYSKLDLYLMGIVGPDEVPDMFVIEPNTDEFSKGDLPNPGVTISGTRKEITMQEFIDVHGERVPNHSEASKTLRYGFIYLTTPGTTVETSDLKGVKLIQSAYEDRFAILTGGRALAKVLPSIEINQDSGLFNTVESDSDQIAGDIDIDLALRWILLRQHQDGYWEDKEATRIRDSLSAFQVLSEYASEFQSREDARDWLLSQDPQNTDSAARILSLLPTRSTLTEKIIAEQNSDGGWGLSGDFGSSVLDTALSICALTSNSFAEAQVAAEMALAYLRHQQNEDGGWSYVKGANSSIGATVEVLGAFECSGVNADEVESTLDWLRSRVKMDHGFGDDESTVQETALVLKLFNLYEVIETIDADLAVAYLAERQSDLGDWEGSVHKTALAITAIQSVNIPNLKIVSLEQNSPIVRDGDFVKIEAVIQNDSSLLIDQNVVRFFLGDPGLDGTEIGSVNVSALPGFASATASVYWNTFGNPGNRKIFVVVDADEELVERSERDNVKSLSIQIASPPAGVELLVNRAEVTASPDVLTSFPTQIEFSSVIRNIGDVDAPQTMVELWRGDPAIDGEKLDTVELLIGARSSDTVIFSINHSVAGDSDFYIVVDPQNIYTESNETNNAAVINLETVDGIDLEVLDTDLSLLSGPVFLNRNVEFEVRIKNKGTISTPSIPVEIRVENVSGGAELLTVNIQLAPGEQRRLFPSWLVDFDGISNIVVEVDPTNVVAETSETNNIASLSLNPSLSVGSNISVHFNDLSVNPSPGFEGMGSTITAVVRNSGTNEIPQSKLSFFDGNPEQGGVLIGEHDVVNLGASESQTVPVTWSVIPDDNTRFIYVVADIDNVIAEIDESDNIAFSKYDVLSLPDFALSAESIQTAPKFPRLEERVVFDIKITNRGKQETENVTVSAYLGDDSSGQEIATTIVDLPGSGDVHWEFDYAFSQFGVSSIFITVDQNDEIFESVESNNVARKKFTVQDGDFYVSDFFLSPDGNGVKDSVDYFYNLANADVINVVVIDQYNDEIKVIDGPGAAESSGSVNWDGTNSQGGIVADGNYTFAVKAPNGEYRGQVSVIVDTNRSALSEAIGTKYSLERNLSCRIGEVNEVFAREEPSLPDTQNIIYSPDDQFVYFTTYLKPYINASGDLAKTNEKVRYPSGVYRALNNGSDVFQLVDDDELSVQSIVDFNVSPDGGKLAILTLDEIGYALWTVGSNGEGLVEVSRFGDPSLLFSDIQYLDEDTISYLQKGAFALQPSIMWTVADAAGAVPAALFDASTLGASEKIWSVDLNNQKSHALVKLSTRFRRASRIETAYGLLDRPDDYSLILIDLKSGAQQRISDSVSDHKWNPLGASFVAADPSNAVLNIYGTDGLLKQAITFDEPQASQFSNEELTLLNNYLRNEGYPVDLSAGFYGRISNIEWNPDASEFAFIIEDYLATIIKSNGCMFVPEVQGSIPQEPHSIYSSILDFLVPESSAQSGSTDDMFGCVIPIDAINLLFNRYQAADGIYIAQIAKSTVTKVAKTSSINASFRGLQPQAQRVIRYLDSLSDKELLSPNATNLSENANGFPITADGFPYIEWAGPSWLVARSIGNSGGDYYQSESLRSLRWLNGARELLITNGDENQFYDRFVTVDNEISPRYRASNNSVLLNLDNPVEETSEVFRERDLTVLESNFTKRGIYPTSTGKFLSYYSEDEVDKCSSNMEVKGYRQFQSLLNLTADLRVRGAHGAGGFLIEGSATDKNFDFYQLEYADVDSPDVWVSISPASDVEVIDGLFTTWVPPYIGNFYVRLTVNDFAGNQRKEIRQLSNRERASISGLYLSESHFSPNADGVQDSTALHFKVLENVNLIAQIFDQSDRLVRSIEASFDVIGSEQNIAWDGRDNNGRIAPDGDYKFTVQNYEFFVALDNTPPKIEDLTKHLFQPYNINTSINSQCRSGPDTEFDQDDIDGVLQLCKVIVDLAAVATVDEDALGTFVLESKPIGSATWQISSNSDDLETSNSGLLKLAKNFPVEAWREHDFRLSAADFAGNLTVVPLNTIKRNKAHMVGYSIRSSVSRNAFGYASHEGYGTAESFRNPWNIVDDEFSIYLEHTAVQTVQFYEVMYRRAGTSDDMASVTIQPSSDTDSSGQASGFKFDLNREDLDRNPTDRYEVQMRVRLTGGGYIDSDKIILSPAWRFLPNKTELVPNVDLGYETNVPVGEVDRVIIWLESTGARRDSRFTGRESIEILTTETRSNGTSQIVKTIYQEQGQILSNDIDPQLSAVQGGQDNLYTLFDDTANLVEECGSGYVVTALLFHHDNKYPVKTQFRKEGSCVELRVDVDPVLASQCNNVPTDLVDLRMFFDVEGSAATDTLDPLFLQIVQGWLPDEVSPILFAQNLPNYSHEYSFRLDTTPYPEGDLKLTAILRFSDGSQQHNRFSVPIVHQAPQAAITYPAANDQVCAVEYYDPKSLSEPRRTQSAIEIQGSVSTVGPDVEVSISGTGLASDLSEGSANGSRTRLLGGQGLYDIQFDMFSGPTRKETVSNTIKGKERVTDRTLVPLKPFSFNPITGDLSAAGILGIPVLSRGGEITFELEATNWSGARQCTSVTAEVDAEVEGVDVVLSGIKFIEENRTTRAYISPNSDNQFDRVLIDYSVEETVELSIEVYKQNELPNGEQELIRSILDAQTVIAGTHRFEWDGTDADGQIVEDGLYRLRFISRDGCGHETFINKTVGVDTTPPSLAISYPNDASNIALNIRVVGQIEDPRPGEYQLQITTQNSGFQLLNTGTGNVDGVLGSWDSSGQTGSRTIRLIAQDALGNRATLDYGFDLPERVDLISSLETSEYYVSPNNDGRLDDLVIRASFETNATATFSIVDQQQNVIRELISDAPVTAGYRTITWDGKSDAGATVSDGTYSVRLTAQGAGNIQTESVNFELDATLPAIQVQGHSGELVALAGATEIGGTITDKNLLEYSVEIVSTPESIGEGLITEPLQIQNSDSAALGFIAALPEAILEYERAYELTIVAKDAAENAQRFTAIIYVDFVPPRIELSEDIRDGIYSSSASPLPVVGDVRDTFLKDYEVYIAPKSTPDNKMRIAAGLEDVSGEVASWNFTGLSDGEYVISVEATDLGGLTSSKSISVSLDNSPPNLGITQPGANGYLTTVIPVLGTANDDHFAEYSLAIASGHIDRDGAYQDLITSNLAVPLGTLLNWSVLPEDGLYTLRLAGRDTAGNESTIYHSVTVDTTPPSAPILSSVSANDFRDAAQIIWQANTEADLAGYNLYRNGVKLNNELLDVIQFDDIELPEGEYVYFLRAVDNAGLESAPSEEKSVKIDRTPPEVVIASPSERERVNLLVNILGTAYSDDDFAEYRVYAGRAGQEFDLIRTSKVGLRASELAQWETLGLIDEEQYIIRLEAEDIQGNQASSEVTIIVDNKAAAAPENLTAEVVNTNDVQLAWESNSSEPDLYGFILYRNGELVGTTEPIIGDLRPYAILTTSYLDADLVDGRFEYVVYSLDQAGNISTPSNTAEVAIDNRRPQAVIVSVEDGQAFDGSLYLLAQTLDLDIANVLFQYRSLPDGEWIDITLDQTAPYEHQWETGEVVYGDYEIRAVATDVGGKLDSDPDTKQVTKRDVVAPSAVQNLAIEVVGGTGTLTWDANLEADLAGYDIYFSSCTDCDLESYDILNTQLITDTFYQHDFFGNVGYSYYVVAKDLTGNTAPASSEVRGVYTGTIATSRQDIVDSLSQIEISTELGINFQRISTTVIGPDGPFATDTISLLEPVTQHVANISLGNVGVYQFTATVADDEPDYVSRVSAPIEIISKGKPSTPTGLVAQDNGAVDGLSLSWLANSVEESVNSYQVYRDGVNVAPTEYVLSASAFSNIGGPVANFLLENSYVDFWSAVGSDVRFGQFWSDGAIVERIELDWASSVYAADSFDIYALIDGRYLKVGDYESVGSERLVTIDLDHAVSTTAIEIRVKRWSFSSVGGRLNQMRVVARDVFDSTTFFNDLPEDGNHQYQVQAVNVYGGLSDLSDAVSVAFGDTTPPEPVELGLVVDRSIVDLSWTESPDAVGYRIFIDDEFYLETGGISFTLDDLKNGTYTFHIVAVDAAGNESADSNRVDATINLALLSAPIELMAYTFDEYREIELEWLPFDDESPNAYNVYRSAGDSSSFEIVDNTDEPFFLDEGLQFDIEYFYQVTALDELGNESAPSNAVSAILTEPDLFPVPLITLPSDAGQPFNSPQRYTDVGGFAEPGSDVYLIHQGEFITEPVSVTGEPNLAELSVSSSGEFKYFDIHNPNQLVSVWRDSGVGSYQAFLYSDKAWVELDNSSFINSLQLESFLRVDQQKLLFKSEVNQEWLLYSLEAGDTETLSFSLQASDRIERVESYSETNQLMVAYAYINGEYNHFRIDLNTFETSPLPENFEFSISPDGRYMVYTTVDAEVSARVVVYDLLQQDTVSVVLDEVDRNDVFAIDHPWSPDGTRILLNLGYESVGEQIGVYDFVADELTFVTDFETLISQIVWDGNKRLAFIGTNDISGVLELRTYSLDTSSPGPGSDPKPIPEPIILPQIELMAGADDERPGGKGDPSEKEEPFKDTGSKLVAKLDSVEFSDITLLGIGKDRSVYFKEESECRYFEYAPAGRFLFEDILLEDGTNYFTAVSVTPDDRVSDPAETVTVIFEPRPMPDYHLEVDVDPEVLIRDRSANIRLRISNLGTTIAAPALMRLSLVTPENVYVELAEQIIGPMSAESAVTIEIPWLPAAAGEYTLLAQIDANSMVDELAEDNNSRIVTVNVLENANPSITLSLENSLSNDRDFGLNERLNGHVTVINPGEAFSGLLTIEVIDTGARIVEVLNQTPLVDQPYASPRLISYQWNTRLSAVGAYSVRARLQDTSGEQLSEDQQVFSITDELKMNIGLRADQYSYQANQDVQLTATLLNRSLSAILSEGTVELVILSDDDTLVFEQTKPVGEILASDRASIAFDWNTVFNAPGVYQAFIILKQGEVELAASTANFEILESKSALSGNLRLSDSELVLNQVLDASSTVSNSGNVDLSDITLVYSVSDAGQTFNSASEPIAGLPIGADVAGRVSLPTARLTDGHYKLTLTAKFSVGVNGQVEKVLDVESFSIIENIPPQLTIDVPTTGSVINSQKVRARMFANDNSAVAGVDILMPTEGWIAAESSLSDSNVFYASLNTLRDGAHVLSARASDDNGNYSNTLSRDFIVDNKSPAISFTNVVPDQIFNAAVTPDFVVTDEHLQQVAASLNGQPWEPGSSVEQYGEYRLIVDAIDRAGNTSRAEVRFTISEVDAPPLKLNAKDDKLVLRRGVWGTVDVLANDKFSKLETLAIEVTTSPQHGNLIEASEGVYNYFPGLLYLGPDIFTYRIVDSATNESSMATVSIDVGPAASCSIVPDHSTTSDGNVSLPGWALTAGDSNSATPRYRISILGNSNSRAFVPGREPRVSYPECSLTYTPSADTRARVTVRYRVSDVATDGAAYTSPVREFELYIDNRESDAEVIIPLLQLLLLDDELEGSNQ